MKISVFDLEGPLSPADHAALACKYVGEKLEFKNFEKIFEMISKYDDYLVENPDVQNELDIGEYNPGDTLRLVAPFLAYYLTDSDLVDISNKTELTCDAKKTIDDLGKLGHDIFVISTSYRQHAYNIANRLNIDKTNVFCTEFNMEHLREKTSMDLIYTLQEEIFQKYLDADLEHVLDELHAYFWKENKHFFSEISVCGGAKKAESLEIITKATSTKLSQVMAVGDSITDIYMLKDTKNNDGFSVSLNGNQYSTRNANIVVVSPSLYAVYLIAHWGSFEEIDIWQDSVGLDMNVSDIPKDIISNKLYKHFKKLKVAPIIYNIKKASKSTISELIEKQKVMRVKNRGWAGTLS